jgi:hypothetical protein
MAGIGMKPYIHATRRKAHLVSGVRKQCFQRLAGNVQAAVITQLISDPASGTHRAATAAEIASANHHASNLGRL